MKYINALSRDGGSLHAYLPAGSSIIVTVEIERLGWTLIEVPDESADWLIERLWSGMRAGADTKAFDSVHAFLRDFVLPRCVELTASARVANEVSS